jgi:hypothetical protein
MTVYRDRWCALEWLVALYRLVGRLDADARVYVDLLFALGRVAAILPKERKKMVANRRPCRAELE